jgi:hypothetical protein
MSVFPRGLLEVLHCGVESSGKEKTGHGGAGTDSRNDYGLQRQLRRNFIPETDLPQASGASTGKNN